VTEGVVLFSHLMSDKEVKNLKQSINLDSIRGKLREKRITQKRLAEILDISERTVNQKLNGIRDLKVSELVAISDVCGVSASFFLTNQSPVE